MCLQAQTRWVPAEPHPTDTQSRVMEAGGLGSDLSFDQGPGRLVPWRPLSIPLKTPPPRPPQSLARPLLRPPPSEIGYPYGRAGTPATGCELGVPLAELPV